MTTIKTIKQLVPTDSDDNPIIKLTIRNDKVVTNSLQIAKMFRKEHKDILQKINDLDCNKDFKRDNFQEYKYINRVEEMVYTNAGVIDSLDAFIAKTKNSFL